ncbi:hypothetical protein D082_00420 [Synechocystis sp. PCC 6714]|nr:hypothetical protein D082_00420 [Synechocystis sp. PCC 6714]
MKFLLLKLFLCGQSRGQRWIWANGDSFAFRGRHDGKK